MDTGVVSYIVLVPIGTLILLFFDILMKDFLYTIISDQLT
jgi:hypothetical protein